MMDGQLQQDGRRAVIPRSSRILLDDDLDEWKTSSGRVAFSRKGEEINFEDVEEIRGDDDGTEESIPESTGFSKMDAGKSAGGIPKEWSWWNAPSIERPSGTSISSSTGSFSEKKSLHELQSEVRHLKLRLKEADEDRWKPLSVRETVKRMMLRKPYMLEPYRSYEDKVSLLEVAICYHDGNCIMAVLQFLKQTLKHRSFFHLLVQFPEAERHYIAFLKQHCAWVELRRLYGQLARCEDEWVLLYNQNRNVTPGDTRVRRLEDCLKFFNSPACEELGRSYYATVVKEQIDLLSRQIPIEEKDAKLERLGEFHLFRTHPRNSPVLYNSLITTLYYCCYYHYEAKPDALRCPAKFRTDFKLSEKQYLWTALKARASLKQWDDFEKLLTTKGWFGSTKLKSPISFDKIAELLHKQKASPDKIEKYARLIDDLSLRFKVLSRIGRHYMAVQTLIDLRDRDQLLQYQDKVPSHDRRAHDLISRSLKDSSIKWR